MSSRVLIKKIATHTLFSPLGFFIVPISIIFFADSTLAFMFPILVEEALGSNMLLGVVMAASSLVGIGCDFVFPRMLYNVSWKKQLILGILFSFLFPLLTLLGLQTALVSIFLLASILWGVYYELLSFAQQNFVTSEEKKSEYTNAWGVLFAFAQFTGIVGPILGSFLLMSSHTTMLFIVVFLQAIALSIAIGLRVHAQKTLGQVNVSSHSLSLSQLVKEFRYWSILAKHVFPAMVMGVWLEAIEATYWTIGGLFGKELSTDQGIDWMPIVLYSAPFIVGSMILSRLHIQHGKKRMTYLMLIVAGLCLAPLYVFSHLQWMVFLIIICSSFALSFAGPLQEAVYSDLLSRSGAFKQDFLGLAKANSSLAYIVFPVVVGYSADTFGYAATFSFIGVFSVIIGVVLLCFSPNKLHVPIDALEKV